MAWTGDPIDPRIYVADIKARLRSWLWYHLNDTEFKSPTDYWGRVGGGVEVLCGHPDERPTAELSQPRVWLQKTGDSVQPIMSGVFGEYAADQERHEFTVRLDCLTDINTGQAEANSMLASAVSYVYAKYQDELATLGLIMLPGGLGGGAESRLERLWVTTQELKFIYVLQCRVLRTISLSLADCVLVAPGQVTMQQGVVLTRPAILQVQLTTASQQRDIGVTVLGSNQNGQAETLSGTIPPGLAAGTTVSLIPQTPGDRFTQVNAVAVGQDDGVAGVAWSIENLAEELT